MEVLTVDLDDADGRDRYDRLFSACPHAFVQQSTDWAEVIGDLGPDRPVFLIASEAGRDLGGLPLYLFEGPAGPILTSVPQAGPLGGVFCVGDADRDRVYAALLAEAKRIAATRRCLGLTIITNPIGDDIDLYRRHLEPEVLFENFTQIVPIDEAVLGGALIIANNKKGNPAATIRKAETSGLTARLCESDTEFAAWCDVHARRAAEIGVAPIARPLLGGIWTKLGPRSCAFLQLAMSDEEIASGILFILHRDICDVFAVSMDSRFAEAAPNYLAVKAGLIEMAARGVKFMNWQSSPSRRDGVYKFKRQWASVERPYYFATKLYRDSAEILALGEDALRRGYENHFVVPFGAFSQGNLAGPFRKA